MNFESYKVIYVNLLKGAEICPRFIISFGVMPSSALHEEFGANEEVFNPFVRVIIVRFFARNR